MSRSADDQSTAAALVAVYPQPLSSSEEYEKQINEIKNEFARRARKEYLEHENKQTASQLAQTQLKHQPK